MKQRESIIFNSAEEIIVTTRIFSLKYEKMDIYSKGDDIRLSVYPPKEAEFITEKETVLFKGTFGDFIKLINNISTSA